MVKKKGKSGWTSLEKKYKIKTGEFMLLIFWGGGVAVSKPQSIQVLLTVIQPVQPWCATQHQQVARSPGFLLAALFPHGQDAPACSLLSYTQSFLHVGVATHILLPYRTRRSGWCLKGLCRPTGMKTDSSLAMTTAYRVSDERPAFMPYPWRTL